MAVAKRYWVVLLIAWLMVVLGSPVNSAQKLSPLVGDDSEFRVVTITQGLQHPWGLAFLPTGEILVTERPGRLRVVSKGQLEPQPVLGLPEITAKGQGGLLDVALHPNYKKNGWIYLSYSGTGPGGLGTELARGRLKGRQLVDLEVLFRLLPKSTASHHFGSRILFDQQGFLYLTTGDRGDRPRAQNRSDHAGSVIRLHDDGRVPPDNPFYGHDGARADIFSYGHRNPQGLALHPVTGAIWLHEHGPQGGDELNRIQAGVNYGWPVITYGVNYGFGTKIGEGSHKEGMRQPEYYWVPSIAPSGMTFYNGSEFPQWQGDLFIGSLKFKLLTRLQMEQGSVVKESRYLIGKLGRIRDVRTGPDGYLYLLTDAINGTLVRLEPR